MSEKSNCHLLSLSVFVPRLPWQISFFTFSDTLLLRVSTEVQADVYSSTFLKCRTIFPSVLRYRPKTFWIYNNTLITKASKGYKIKDDYARESLGKSNFSFPFDLIIPNVTSDEYGQYTCGVEYTVGQEKVKLIENVNLTTIKKHEGELKEHVQKGRSIRMIVSMKETLPNRVARLPVPCSKC